VTSPTTEDAPSPVLHTREDWEAMHRGSAKDCRIAALERRVDALSTALVALTQHANATLKGGLL
jgi:hypothetical protein